MTYFNSITELIGRTPLVRLNNYEKDHGLGAVLLAKLELMNPAGSAKDRVALQIIEDAEKNGTLKHGSTIIEPTSGNTGIGLAAVAAIKGYRVLVVMPDTMSIERIKIMKAYGAEVVLTDGKKGMNGAIEKARELSETIPDSIIAGQFVNQSNPAAHYNTTGPEIWSDTDGKVDIFVAGIGTGGTLTGTGRFLKAQNPNVKVYGFEPTGSPVLNGGKSGSHGLQGIGAGFVPEILDMSVCDGVLTVSDEDAYEACRCLARREGLLVGITSGAAVYAASVIASRPENAGKTVVALLPDTGMRYLSTPMFD